MGNHGPGEARLGFTSEVDLRLPASRHYGFPIGRADCLKSEQKQLTFCNEWFDPSITVGAFTLGCLNALASCVESRPAAG
jgi:hypothetical protein